MREDLLAALAWQVDLGADEAIAETPVDRFAAAVTPAPPPAPVAATPRGPDPSRGTPDLARHGPSQATPAPDSPAALAAGATSLDALARTMAAWEGSDLRQGARNFVFADGRPGAPLMIIGEAPGADEDRQGKPFVGRAGQLLDRMLAAIGLDRQADDLAKSAY
ncbi:MAG: uracil-DNA glycosylase family protein, partial [Pseudomonadota bacterium]